MPPGFEQLRAAYEEARVWAHHRARISVQKSPQADPQPEPAERRDSAGSFEPAAAPDVAPVTARVATALALRASLHALDEAVTSRVPDSARVRQLFDACLKSPALQAVDIQLQTEHTLAHWLLARRPATDALFAAAAARFDWLQREGSVHLSADIRSALQYLHDVEYWTGEQRATGNRARARMLLMGDPKPAAFRLKIAMFGVDEPARALLGTILSEHPGVAGKLNARSLAWWQQYFSKPRLSMHWLRGFGLLLPVLAFFALLVGLQNGHPIGYPILAVLAALAVIAAILAFKLYAIDWVRRCYLHKYKTRIPLLLRMGWFPAAAAGFLLTALLPDSGLSIAVAALWALACLAWVFIATNAAALAKQSAMQRLRFIGVINLPLTAGWLLLSVYAPGHWLATWPTLLVMLVSERIGAGALSSEYRYGIFAARHKMLWLILLSASLLTLYFALGGAAGSNSLRLLCAISAVLAVTARTPALRLSRRQLMIRYYALYVPTFIVLRLSSTRWGAVRHRELR